jgi:lipopolysaccharide transport protein LptA
MSWQKKARLGIAVFVIVFIAVVALAMRQRKDTPAGPPPPERTDPKTTAEAAGGLNQRFTKDGKVVFAIESERNFMYPDGRTVQRGVTLTLPDRGGRSIVVTAQELENLAKERQAVGAVKLTGDVRLKTSDGVEVKAAEAAYDEAAGVLTIPGKVEFAKARMTGTGIGATYDRNRDVLWLYDQARITVAADPKGEGAMLGTSDRAGLARADHYLRLTGHAHITADGRVIDADDITVMLTPDDERVQMLQLRANSRISGGTGGGPQAMSARDIDLTYGENGRTLQHAQLIENAVVQLQGSGGGPGQRVVGRTIDIAMAPDGATVTNLTASENVQLDLPPEAGAPAKRIRAATLASDGGTEGLQTATFAGEVEYRETRAAGRNVAAVDRTARSQKLVVNTKPGLGAIQRAEFSGNVHIKDGTEVTAEAPHAVYFLDLDRMDLSPGDGSQPGRPPHVSDGRVSVDARTISLTLGTRVLSAETRVRSSMRPEPKAGVPAAGAAPKAGATPAKVSSMLKQDEPVNVTSNRLGYDGAAGHATYSGNARLWQGDTSIDADTIVIDDKTGNLEARGGVRTMMQLGEVDAKTGKTRTTATSGTADTFLYEEEKRLATYTTSAHIVGAERDVTGDRIELFLEEKDNELERAEAYGQVEVKETGRTATGNRLTYTAAAEEYFMTGAPVIVIQKSAAECKKTTASSVKFRKAIETVNAGGVGALPLTTTSCPVGGTR